MAVFDEANSTWQRIDWQLLRDGPITLYHSRMILEESCLWLEEHGYHVYHFDCHLWRTAEDFHRDVQQKLHFPDNYGKNLNAFNDSLAYSECMQEDVVLVFSGFDTFANSYPSYAQHVLDIIAKASRIFMLFGHRLITLVQSDDREISFDPVGAFIISLNPEEWRHKRKI